MRALHTATRSGGAEWKKACRRNTGCIEPSGMQLSVYTKLDYTAQGLPNHQQPPRLYCVHACVRRERAMLHADVLLWYAACMVVAAMSFNNGAPQHASCSTDTPYTSKFGSICAAGGDRQAPPPKHTHAHPFLPAFTFFGSSAFGMCSERHAANCRVQGVFAALVGFVATCCLQHVFALICASSSMLLLCPHGLPAWLCQHHPHGALHKCAQRASVFLRFGPFSFFVRFA